MRFFTRSLFGMVLLALTAGLFVLAGNTLFDSFKAQQDQNNRRQAANERVFAVNTVDVVAGAVVPKITTFGEIVSGRTLELRAAAGGELVQLSSNFREGSTVFKDELLFQTDPAAAQADLELAKTEVAEAVAELQEAKEAETISRDELVAAQEQLELRQQSLERQKSLRSRGVGTEAALETAALAESGAKQTVLSKRQALANASARINRAETSLARIEINLEEAQRRLDDTIVTAEFDGVLSNVTAVKGGLVSANERLAQLIDPSALEVKFRISSNQYANLVSSDRGLSGAEVLVEFVGLERPLAASIERVSAAVGEGQTGRELFAKLSADVAELVRPGDFVSVTIEEPILQNAALIPATAISNGGEVLVIEEDNRLRAETTELLRRQGDAVIIAASALNGQRIVEKRAPQLGTGILVEPRSKGSAVLQERKMVVLTPEQQSQMTAAVEANRRMPDGAKKRVLAMIEKGEVPEENFQRLERMAARMAGNNGGAAAGAEETVQVSDEMREKMIAFVQTNDQIPADFKERVLENLSKPEVPKQVYDRIKLRMGG